MKTKNLRTFAMALGTGLLLLNSTPSLADCWNGGCLWSVPLYDQKDENIPDEWFPEGNHNKSMLCVPTAASMAYQGTYMNIPPAKAAGWLQSSFIGKSKQTQIVNTAVAMSTNPSKGTGGGAFGIFAARQPEFLYKLNNLFVPKLVTVDKKMATLSFSTISASLKKAPTALTVYGHYSQKTVTQIAPGSKITQIEYQRKGGHAVTARGYNSGYVIYNDPWGGKIMMEKLASRKKQNSSKVVNGVTEMTVEVLPGDSAIAYYFSGLQSGTYYPLLDRMMAHSL
jgi:hypothetical protein